MDATGDYNFGIFGTQGAIAVVNDNGNFGKTHGGTLFGTAENHVLHLAHTERGGALFAQDPTDGVGNVGLAAAVRTHHRRKALGGEIDFGPLGKGLETEYFELCNLHYRLM
jgi:hypothetical protein